VKNVVLIKTIFDVLVGFVIVATPSDELHLQFDRGVPSSIEKPSVH